jgi:hypothetical protein
MTKSFNRLLSTGLYICLAVTAYIPAAEAASEGYLFMTDMIQSMSFVRSSETKLKAKGASPSGADETYVATRLIDDFKAALQDLETAKTFLVKYADSADASINRSAVSTRAVLNSLIANYRDIITFCENAYIRETEGTEEEIMSKGARLTAEKDRLFKEYMHTTAASASLPLDEREKNLLKEQLFDCFGEQIKSASPGSDQVFAPAAALYASLLPELKK